MPQVSLIKQWLDYKHMTQKELAQKMDVSQSFISYYVNKKNIKYRYKTAEKFSEAFDIDYQEFMKGPNIPSKESEGSSLLSDEVESEENMRLRIINIVMSSGNDDLKFYYDFLTRCINPNE